MIDKQSCRMRCMKCDAGPSRDATPHLYTQIMECQKPLSSIDSCPHTTARVLPEYTKRQHGKIYRLSIAGNNETWLCDMKIDQLSLALQRQQRWRNIYM